MRHTINRVFLYLLPLLLFCVPLFCFSLPSVIPAPVEMKAGSGTFMLENSTVIFYPAEQKALEGLAAYLSSRLRPATGFALKTVTAKQARSISLSLTTAEAARIGKEGYFLKVAPEGISISANTPAGIFYGIQTLLQLFPAEIEGKNKQVSWGIEGVEITDYPRFQWRGIMLDVSRHFFPKEYVKTYIDQISRLKYNRLHLHLTDDNGWRVEIKSLPRLTSVGAWRVPRTGTFGKNEPPKPGEKATYGGFYTQDDIRDLVAYGKERFVEILPEIDVPGHSMAAIAAYPHLAVTKDSTIKVNPGTQFSTWYGDGKFKMHIDNTLNPADEKVYDFMDKVIKEVAALFPFEYLHIGGDECYKGYWERDPGVKAFMNKNNLKNGEELQSYFTRRVGKIVAANNKKMIGWDEILEGGIAPDAAVMSWRGTKGGEEAARHKHTVVMSPAPHYYLDMGQGEPSVEPPIYSTARLREVYDFSILPPGIDSTYVLGGQGNLWTEQIPTTAQVEYMTYPRAFAISESLWSAPGKKDWEAFTGRVERHFARFDQAGINYSTSMYDPMITVRKNQQGEIMVEMKAEVPNVDFHYTVDNSVPNHFHPRYQNTIVLPSDADNFRVISYRNGKPLGRLITLSREDLVKRIKK